VRFVVLKTVPVMFAVLRDWMQRSISTVHVLRTISTEDVHYFIHYHSENAPYSTLQNTAPPIHILPKSLLTIIRILSAP
jgi:hypothetical protein